jgi:predicted TPR repeat methyltransferase
MELAGAQGQERAVAPLSRLTVAGAIWFDRRMPEHSDTPGQAEASYRQGAVHFDRGEMDSAVACFEKALALAPAHAAACLHLADALMEAHVYDRALATYRRALTLRCPFPEAHHNLAAALLHLGDAAGAVEECRRALGERPGNALALNTLGVALEKLDRFDEAIAAFQQALSIRPHYAKAHYNLGNVLDRVGRTDEAKKAYHAALALNPNLEEARYDLAALGEGPPPPATPRPYLMRLFDTYAVSFDQHLVEALDYHVPEMLYAAVMAVQPSKDLDVIDLGCGTGLVGKLFRGMARRLTGVDVSPGMIRQAERRQVYDQLVLEDVVRYLNARRQSCDVVLAGDLFIYLGDLAEVFAAVARLLTPGGLFAFSLETTAAADYVLQPNRRYAQSWSYIQRLSGNHGLEVLAADPVKLRRDAGSDAQGLIVVLRASRAQTK